MSSNNAFPNSTTPELLSPGGTYEKIKIAFLYGADAVYAGGKNHSLRSYSKNLSHEELAAATFLAHSLGKKLYVTVNTFLREADTKTLPDYLEYLQDIDVDALIISDPGLLSLAQHHAPNLTLHLSTQANTTNSLSARFWANQGVKRLNLARELSLEELREIRTKTDAELEIFVHGAMCVSYSGRCLLSAFLNDRSANSGLCTQPCRWSFRLVEEKRPGQYFPIHENSKGTYILNSKDLCLLGELGILMEIGIDAFKIEGRMKGHLYLSSVTRAYRKAIDLFRSGQNAASIHQLCIKDLEQVSHRPYTKGLLMPASATHTQGISPDRAYIQSHTLAALVRPSFPVMSDSISSTDIAPDLTLLQARTRLNLGAILEFLYPDGSSVLHNLDYMENMKGTSITHANPNSWICVPLPFPTFPSQVVRTSSP